MNVDIAELVRRTREAQGLPRYIEDEKTLARVATLVREKGGPLTGRPRSPIELATRQIRKVRHDTAL